MKNNTLVRSLKIAFKTCPLDCVLMLIVQLLIAFLPIGGLYILKCLINSMTTESANVSKDAFEDITREFDKDKYLMAQSNIANRIMEYQEKIMNREIEFGLEKDYE